MVKLLTYFFCITLLLSCAVSAQNNCGNISEGRILFYNVENLFDAEDDPSINDSQYLPTFESRPWTEAEYQEKTMNIAKVINNIMEDQNPLVIGLTEVENLKVLEDLVYNLNSSESYEIVHKNSLDERGIDAALLYNKDLIEMIETDFFFIKYPFEPEDKTREIVYLHGKICDGEEIHIFVNHWKSRYGGQAETEAKRVYIAEQLKSQADQIKKKNPSANILIMGDLNDEYNDKSIAQSLGAKYDKESMNREKDLFNTMAVHARKGKGTINYQCKWQVFDHIIISPSLMDKKGLDMKGESGQIYKEEYILYKNGKCNDMTPSRYSSTSRVFHGYSDHLPVYIDLNWTK